ncbi:MAG: hypothetical protein M3285_06245 [Actinomycetota bacterium]|nr:hypothetical protein [Actinomycetota bacterium]
MRRRLASAVAAMALLSVASPARAQPDDCSRVVVFTTPAVTWEDVERVQPPNLLELTRAGAAGSVSVRAISPRTSYAAGFTTIGGGSRIDALRRQVTPDLESTPGPPGVHPRARTVWDAGAWIPGARDLRAEAIADGYGAEPGALGSALAAEGVGVTAIGNADTGHPTPPAPAGSGRWVLLAAMEEDGTVARSATVLGLTQAAPDAPFGVRTDQAALERVMGSALERRCSVTFVDHGDLERADEWALATGKLQVAARDDALRAADETLGSIVERLDFATDLLLVVSPTSPWWDWDVHLGIAVARGPGFESGDTLQSAFTRRRGVVSITDVAPTVLAHLGLARPESMTGRRWFAVDGPDDPVAAGIAIDRESVFVENMKTPVSAGFVLAQVLTYLLAIVFIARRERTSDESHYGRYAEWASLAIVAFPISTFLAGAVNQHDLGIPGMVAVLVGIDLALVAGAILLLRGAFDRLLAITGVTFLVLCADLLTGGRLQLNTVLGYSPVVGGRYAGLGNIAFAILGISALLTGALIVHRGGGRRRALVVAAMVFGAAVVFDGTPQLGSDVGGVLALVPALGVTILLLAGRRPNWRVALISAVAAAVLVGVFLAVDVSRPDDQQTHLARLYEDVRDRGAGVMTDTIVRKLRANARLFRSTLWTFFVPPALLAIAFLLRRPRGRWQALAEAYPKLRSGLLGGLLLAVIGFALNDSGIVIPAVILTYLVPMSVILHLCLLRDGRLDPEPDPS